MKRMYISSLLAVSLLTTAWGARYDKLSTSFCDADNHVIYDGKGNFTVKSPLETIVELTLDLNSFISYANSNDYKSGNPLLLWDTDSVDYGMTDMAASPGQDGARTPAITGYWVGKVWQPAQKIDYATLKKYAGADGKVNITVTNSNAGGVTVTVKKADGGTEQLYKAPRLMAGRNTAVLGYKVNLNYVTAVTLHTPSTLDTSTYTPPPDYTVPYTSKRAGGMGLGRVMFMGDSITHGVNDKTWRWQFFKILVDNGIEAEIVGPRSGYTPGYARLATRDIADNYGGVEFPNVHLAQSSGRTHNIITGSNAGMTGVNYGGHSTGSSADAYNCNTWFCLMGTNDLLSDRGYSATEFAAKMQRLLGGKVVVKGNRYVRNSGKDWGNMGKIATDVLRDKGDVLYVMSVPCWGLHSNNNAADRHEAVRRYNELLCQWVKAFGKASGLDVRYVDINTGMVDPAAEVPFTWPDSMSNRPGRDGLHPNEQGSLIMAGNLARALGIGGRTAGLSRADSVGWNRANVGKVKKGVVVNRPAELSSEVGYTVELKATFGNGERTGWSGVGECLSVRLCDGMNAGVLNMSEGSICWGDKPLYCGDMSALSDSIRIAWHKGSSEHNVLPGYYVWVGDMLVGQGLPAESASEKGIFISSTANGGTVSSLRWTSGARAPQTERASAAEYSYSITCATGSISPDKIYADHMILQRGASVPVCGTCEGTEPVTVIFNGHTVQADVQGGRWSAVLPPMQANAVGQNLTIAQGSETVVLRDVLVGDVWVASGQSNMLWRLNQTGDTNSLRETEMPLVRFYHSEPQVHTSPPRYGEREKKLLAAGEMYKGGWATNTPQTRPRMSAVGYYFGRELQKQIGIPVGVIHAALGGSEMMAWMPAEVLRAKYPECTTADWLNSRYMSAWVRGRARQNIGADLNAPHPYKPGYLFETGIKPWLNFPVTGVIWYQGESDAEIQDMEQNYTLLADLINGWRTAFGKSNLPFLQVELPRINDKSPLRAYWPEFRTVQRRAADCMPGVYALTTIDLGSKNSDVHPPRKLEVGTRLAMLAAAEVYGLKMPFSGPVVNKVEPLGESLVVHMEHAEGLKTTDGQAPVGFEVSADRKTYYPAKAVLKNQQIILSSPHVQAPRYARYGWYTYMEPNLVNEYGLPAVPYAGN